MLNRNPMFAMLPLVVVTAFAGCAAPVDSSDEADGETGEARAALQICTPGTYKCAAWNVHTGLYLSNCGAAAVSLTITMEDGTTYANVADNSTVYTQPQFAGGHGGIDGFVATVVNGKGGCTITQSNPEVFTGITTSGEGHRYAIVSNQYPTAGTNNLLVSQSVPVKYTTNGSTFYAVAGNKMASYQMTDFQCNTARETCGWRPNSYQWDNVTLFNHIPTAVTTTVSGMSPVTTSQSLVPWW